jgi:hypothetical protein
MAIKLGSFCTVKKEVWDEYCWRSGNTEDPPLQPVTSVSIPPVQPAGYAMLAYPHWWWKLDELIEM